MKKAALICVTRNNAEKLQTTLNSIIRNTKPEDYDLIIIDNASSDATLGIYQQSLLAEHITIVRSGKNLNWVGGINLGLEMTKNYQYVGFLNDDIEVCPNWLENFFDVLDCNPDVAAVGPLTSNTRDWQGYDNVRSIFSDWGLPLLDEVDRGNVAEMYKYICINGTGCTISNSLAFFCILFRRSAIDKIGFLDLAFSELNCCYDQDFCEQLMRLKYKLALSTRTYVSKNQDSCLLPTAISEANKIAALEILNKKRKAYSEQKILPQNAAISKENLSSFIEMKSFWEPLMRVMPFFNYCAKLVSPSQPFPELESYVFNPGKPFALCSLYTPEVVAYAAESEKSILRYCLQHDYTAYIYRAGLYSGIHPTWHKARILLNHLAGHQSMVWLDADTLILDQENKIFECISNSPKSLHISRDLTDSGPTPYNAGVLIVKNSPWSIELLNDCDKFTINNKPTNLWDHGSDQKVLCDLILSKDPNREFHEVYEMSVFNTDPRFVDKKTFLLHFMSYPSGFRIPWMSFWNAHNLDFQEADFFDRIKPL